VPITLIALCIGLGSLASCASVPEIDQSTGPTLAATSKPEIIGGRGALTTQQSKALLERISTEPGDAGVLQRHLAIEEAVAESPLIAGNRTQLLRDGPASFRAMFNAIQGATDHINLEYFNFEDVESDGVKLGDLLVAKREAGVSVNVIYDSFGSSSTPDAFFDRLKQAGANVVDYNPVNPFGIRSGVVLAQ
jgi:cardiolipin synthase